MAAATPPATAAAIRNPPALSNTAAAPPVYVAGPAEELVLPLPLLAVVMLALVVMLPVAITLPLMLIVVEVLLPIIGAVVAIAGTLMVVVGAAMADVKGTSATLEAPTKAGAGLRVGTRLAGAGAARPGLRTLYSRIQSALTPLQCARWKMCLRINDMRNPIRKEHIRQHDLSLIDKDRAINDINHDRLTRQRQYGAIADILREDDRANHGMVLQNGLEGLDRSVGEGRASELEGLVVGYEDGEVLRDVESADEVGFDERAGGGGQVGVEGCGGELGRDGEDFVDFVDCEAGDVDVLESQSAICHAIDPMESTYGLDDLGDHELATDDPDIRPIQHKPNTLPSGSIRGRHTTKREVRCQKRSNIVRRLRDLTRKVRAVEHMVGEDGRNSTLVTTGDRFALFGAAGDCGEGFVGWS